MIFGALILNQSAASWSGEAASDKPVALASLPSPDMPSLRGAIKDCMSASGNRKTTAAVLQQLGWLPAKLKTWSPFASQPGKNFTKGAGSAVVYLDRSSTNSPLCSVTGVIEKTKIGLLANTVAEAASAKKGDVVMGSMLFSGAGSMTGMKVETAGSLLNYRISVLFVNQEQQ